MAEVFAISKLQEVWGANKKKSQQIGSVLYLHFKFVRVESKRPRFLSISRIKDKIQIHVDDIYSNEILFWKYLTW